MKPGEDVQKKLKEIGMDDTSSTWAYHYYIFRQLRNNYVHYAATLDKDMYISPLDKVEKKLQFFEVHKNILLLGIYRKCGQDNFKYLLSEVDTLERAKRELAKESNPNLFSSRLKTRISEIKAKDITDSGRQVMRQDVKKKIVYIQPFSFCQRHKM